MKNKTAMFSARNYMPAEIIYNPVTNPMIKKILRKFQKV